MEGLGVPQRIGKYTVDSVLGQGGMGVVYKAHDNYRRVAIKMMLTTLSSNPKLMGRFHREAQLTALLEHPNIVIVHDWGEQDGAPYLVMQYLEGTSLDACRFDVPPTMALLKKLRIVSQVCAGLHYAHCQKMEVEGKIFNGIVHRDIKPANIFVLDNGNETVKLLDFGIAHLGLDGEGGERPMTRTGQLIGSLVYMSPEQANGARLDTRTDIFSLGVVLYELVAGVRPFEGHDTISTITRILTSPPPPIEHYLPDCPTELIELILRALEKSPRDRYQTAEELAFDLSLIETQLRRQLAKEQLELAESAMERSDWVKALEILIELLKLDGEHVRGLSMHREVQQILRRQRRVEDAARLKAKATEKMEMRQFKDALRLAEEAINLDDSNYDLIVFRDDIRKSLQRSERSRLAAERAENNLRSDRLPAAASSLEEAFQLDPENTQALNLRPRVAEALAEQSRRAQFQSLLRNVEESLAERRYQSALDLLEEARALQPDAPELDTLSSRAVQGQEQERRRQQLKARGEEVGALLAAGSLDQAGEKLSAAMRSYPGEPSLQELEDGLVRLRREESVRLAVDRAETCLRGQRLADAQAAVGEALSLDPASASAQQVGARIAAAVAEQARRAQLELLVQQARDCLSRQSYDEALEHLRAAESIDAHSQEVAGLIEQAVQGREQERRRQELQSIGEEVEALLAAGSLGQAEEKLSAALGSYPGEPSLLGLESALWQLRREEAVRHALKRAETGLAEQRLQDAQAALDEVFSLEPNNESAQRLGARIAAAIAEQARRAQLQLLLQQARESLTQQHFADALERLQAAQSLETNSPEVSGLIEQALQGQEQERRRQELKSRGEEIEALLGAGSIDRAGEKLSSAMRSYPGEPSLLELERTLWQLRRKEGVRRALEHAERGLEQQRLEDAQAAVEEALLLDPENPGAQQVGERVTAAIADRARRAQLQLLLQQARENLAQQQYGDARNHLSAAEALDTNAPEVAALYEQVVQGEEQERRRQELKALAAEAGALLAAGNFGQAEEKLSTALWSYPGEPSLVELEGSLSKLRREEAIRLALKRAESGLRERRLEDAQTALDEVLALDPAHPGARPLQPRIERARFKEAQASSLMEQASKDIELRRYTSALDLLKQAQNLDAGLAGLDGLVQRALEGQAREKRQSTIDALDEEIRELIAGENFSAARSRMTAALRQFPEEQRLLDLDQILTQKQSAAELRQAKLKHEREIFTIFKGIRKLIEDGKLAAAQSKLTIAEKRFPEEPALLELSRELSARRDQEQQRTIMLTVIEPAPADADSVWQLQQVSGDHPLSPTPSLTQGMESGSLTSMDAVTTRQDGVEVKAEPQRPVLPAIDLTHWQDAVVPPPAAEVQSSPAKQGTVWSDDFVPAAKEASAVVVEPPAPHETTAPVVARPVTPAKIRAEEKAAPPARIPPRVVAAQRSQVRPAVWGAAAVVVLGGIVYGVLHRASSPAKTEPVIATVPVSIVTTPVGAKVQITGNGQSKDCVTPQCAIALPPGSYEAKATLQGYQESDQALEVRAGLAPVQMQLAPISLVEAGPEASLVVEIPGVQEASVFIDNKEYKATGSELRIPANLHKTYQIQVRKDGYQPSAAEPFTLAHSTEKLVVRLKELPNAATLVLDQSTPNAEVLIDDQSAGRMSSSGRFRTTVPPGPHKIQLSLDGRASDAGSRQFDPRGRVTLSLNVPPAPMVAKAPAGPAKVEPAPAAAPPVVTPPSASPDVAKTLWESIRDTTDPGVLTKFGNQYPDYADRVRERVTALDQKTWDQAKDSGDERRLKAYLAGFPDGKYASNAREAIEASHKNADEAAIRQTLENFSRAIDDMSLDQLRQAWPTIGKKQADGYKQLFSAASKIRSRLSVSSLKVTGDTAEVESQDSMVVDMGGRSQNSAPAMKIRLRKTGSGWVIDQVN